MNKINIHFDMETSDPDDVFTLCLLSHHPKVNLRSVSITPGSKSQVGVVKHLLNILNLNIPIGSKNKDHPKECVSEFHYKWFGKISPAEPDGIGADIIYDSIKKYPDLTIVCGAPLGNIGALLDKDIFIYKIVVQGGFAGDNIVADPLDKFKGRVTCPTFNLNGDVKSAIKILTTNKIGERRFVSKNVCHGVKYDNDMHKFMEPYKSRNPGLGMIYKGMSIYLNEHHDGKAFHDPLAACCAIDSSVCSFEEVQLYRSKGEWGCNKNDPNALISTKVDIDKFRRTIVGD